MLSVTVTTSAAAGAAAGISLTSVATSLAVSTGLGLISAALIGSPKSKIPALAKTNFTSAVGPKRHIIGETRTAGQVVLLRAKRARPDDRKSTGTAARHMVVVLGEGPLEGSLSKVWLNNGEDQIDLYRVASDNSDRLIVYRAVDLPGDLRSGDPYHNTFFIYYFPTGEGWYEHNPHGIIFQGQTSASENLLNNVVEDNLWTVNSKLEGRAFAHVVMALPNIWREEQTEFDPFPQVPNLEFLIKGEKTNKLGSTTKIYSDNAILHRYNALKWLRDIPDEAFDQASFDQAFNYADEMVEFGLSSAEYDGYRNPIRRYTANGVIVSPPLENIQNVEDELDFCSQGYVVEFNNKLHFRVGMDYPAVATIGDDDIIERGEYNVAPLAAERSNIYNMTLAQSSEMSSDGTRGHDYNESTLYFEDTQSLALDGNRKLPVDLGERRFVNDMVSGGHLMATSARLARVNTKLAYRVRPGPPGDPYKFCRVKPSDVILLNDSKEGIETERCLVLTTVFDPVTAEVAFGLQPLPLGTYADSLVLPEELPQHRQLLRINQPPPEPTGVSMSCRTTIASDGTMEIYLDVTWGNDTEFLVEAVLDADIPNRVQRVPPSADNIRFQVFEVGNYTAEVRQVTRWGIPGPSVSVVCSAHAVVPTERMFVTGYRQAYSTLLLYVSNFESKGNTGVVLRYRQRALDFGGTVPATISEDQWDGLPLMNVASVVPETYWTTITAEIPNSGRFRIFGRIQNRVGQLGPITDLGQYLFNITGVQGESAHGLLFGWVQET